MGRSPSAKTCEVARELAVGLAAAHRAGALHRDPKPANVMLDGRGRARIADFYILLDALPAHLRAGVWGSEVTWISLALLAAVLAAGFRLAAPAAPGPARGA